MEIVLPYAGSKQKLWKLIKDSIPENKRYIEPFSGGFSLGLELLDKGGIKRAVVNDIDSDVINFWQQVKDDPWGLASGVDTLIEVHNSLRYRVSQEELKRSFGAVAVNATLRAALFYLYRRMNYGTSRKNIDINLSYGDMAYMQRFMDASNLLQDATIVNRSYEQLKELDGKETLWYLDPPYYKAQNFKYYAACDETEFYHTSLRDFCKGLQGDFILSYNDCETMRDWYSWCYIYSIKVRSYVNSSGYTDEIVISSYPLTLDNFKSDSRVLLK